MAGKYDHIDFKPPKSVADAAARGLELRQKAKKSHKGGLTTGQAKKEGVGSGVQRAVNLKNRDTLSPETVRRMLRFFMRHAKNIKVDPGKTPQTDRGYIAGAVWGGQPGYAWARKIVRQMDAADEKAKKKKKKARAALIPIFEQIVRTAGVVEEALDGIRPAELVILAGIFDAAGLYSEADALDAMLQKIANDGTDEGDPVTDDPTDEGDPVDDEHYRDYSEEGMAEIGAESDFRQASAEEMADDMVRELEHSDMIASASHEPSESVVAIGIEKPIRIKISRNKSIVIIDRDGVEHAARDGFGELFYNQYGPGLMGLIEDFI